MIQPIKLFPLFGMSLYLLLCLCITFNHPSNSLYCDPRQLETAWDSSDNCAKLYIKIRYSGACDSFVRILPQRTPDCSASYCVTCPTLDFDRRRVIFCVLLYKTLKNFAMRIFCAGKPSPCKIGLNTQAVQKFVFYKPLSILAFSHNELLSLSSFV